MKQELIDAITNVRVVAGIIRMDLMKITGQEEDGKYIFEKCSEIAMSTAAFAQSVRTFQEVDKELRERAANQIEKQESNSSKS